MALTFTHKNILSTIAYDTLYDTFIINTRRTMLR